MDSLTQYHGPSTDDDIEWLAEVYIDERGVRHTELKWRPLFAGQSDTAVTWSPPVRHEDLGRAS